MRDRRLVAIYERAWRPVLATVLMGFDPGLVRHERRRAADLLRLEPGQTVLDVACGPGNFTAAYADRVSPGGLVVGLDYSVPMLERARRDHPHPAAAYVRGDAQRLPLPDASVDAVACHAALHLIPDPDAALTEMARVLRPGGRIGLLASVARSRVPAAGVVGWAAGLGGIRVFGRDEVTGWLRAHGFEAIHQEVHGLAQFVSATKV
jgi:ubiquinone/menaquinone biosynthesis C-methylase UbiE